MALIIGIVTVISTLLGGLFALRYKDKLHLILGFSAGAVIGVAFFDLIPEAINLGAPHYSPSTLLTMTAIGFLAFMIFDRALLIHGGHSHDTTCERETHRDTLGAAALVFHSLLDGAAIGLAFHVSPAVGAIVAAAVLTHDFSDGMNTVNLILKNNGSSKRAMGWLVADALAPFLGVISTYFFSLAEPMLGLILALFAGFFLYIGTADLLPESHHRHPNFVTTLMTILGAGVLYGAVHLAGL